MGQLGHANTDIAERGQGLYEREILARLNASAHGKFLVLDIESGEYEVDRDELAAFKRVRSRCPEGRFYFLRVGFSAAYHFGGATRATRRSSKSG
jgi:hypothetical protein